MAYINNRQESKGLDIIILKLNKGVDTDEVIYQALLNILKTVRTI